MRLHAIFPQTEIGNDPGSIAAFVREIEALGFDGLVAYDHVLGADPARPNWSGPYTIESSFHEVFVLFGFAAAVTKRLQLSTGVLIIPQRQTALVAKQAAVIDQLSDGRSWTNLVWRAMEQITWWWMRRASSGPPLSRRSQNSENGPIHA